MNLPQQKNLTAIDAIEFTGTVVSKLANSEFMVKLTKFPNKSKIPDGTEILIKAKLSGRVTTKTARTKVGVFDTVIVAISYDSAKSKTGTIVRREKKLIVPAPA